MFDVLLAYCWWIAAGCIVAILVLDGVADCRCSARRRGRCLLPLDENGLGDCKDHCQASGADQPGDVRERVWARLGYDNKHSTHVLDAGDEAVFRAMDPSVDAFAPVPSAPRRALTWLHEMGKRTKERASNIPRLLIDRETRLATRLRSRFNLDDFRNWCHLSRRSDAARVFGFPDLVHRFDQAFVDRLGFRSSRTDLNHKVSSARGCKHMPSTATTIVTFKTGDVRIFPYCEYEFVVHSTPDAKLKTARLICHGPSEVLNYFELKGDFSLRDCAGLVREQQKIGEYDDASDEYAHSPDHFRDMLTDYYDGAPYVNRRGEYSEAGVFGKCGRDLRSVREWSLMMMVTDPADRPFVRDVICTRPGDHLDQQRIFGLMCEHGDPQRFFMIRAIWLFLCALERRQFTEWCRNISICVI